MKEVGQEERTLGGDGEIVAWGRVSDLLEDSRFKVVEHDLAPGLCLQSLFLLFLFYTLDLVSPAL